MMGVLGRDPHCPVARSLDVLGEKWTLLIVRDALFGMTRYTQFLDSLGIPREILSARLRALVDAGVLTTSSYKPESGRVRQEYLLTDAGRELSVALLALAEWADRHRPTDGTSSIQVRERATDTRVTIAPVSTVTGTVLSTADLTVHHAPPNS